MEVKAAGTVALDTEFLREETYFARLALVQIGLPTRIALVDPSCVAGDAGAGLVHAIGEAVLHAPGEDYGVLMHTFGAAPTRTFDSQIAAAFAGLAPSLGLRELLRQLMGVDLPKDQTRSDWLRRPLSADQQRYAADDVRYLLPMRELLLARLEERGHTAWCEDECRRMRAIGCETTSDPQPHWSFRRADELDPAAQRRLYRLLHWRELRARASNKPRNWLAPPALLLALAQSGPENAAEVARILTALKLPAASKRCESLLAALQPAEPALETAFLPAPAQLDGAAKRRFNQLKADAEQRALKLALPIELLAPRRLLEPLARDQQWPESWRGWREQALGPL